MTDSDTLQPVGLRYQWHSGYDESDEPGDEPEWQKARCVYIGDMGGHADSEVTVIYNRWGPESWVRSDTSVNLMDTR